MIRGFKKLFFLSFIFSVGLVSDTPSIAGMADKYREENECNWNTAKYESLDGKRRYCVNRSGNIYVIYYRGSMNKLDGSFNRTTKKYESWGNHSTLTEWNRDGNKLIKYSCGTENSSTSPDCSFTMDKDVVAYTLKEAKIGKKGGESIDVTSFRMDTTYSVFRFTRHSVVPMTSPSLPNCTSTRTRTRLGMASDSWVTKPTRASLLVGYAPAFGSSGYTVNRGCTPATRRTNKG